MGSEKDEFKKKVLDGLQLAYKVTANKLEPGQTYAMYVEHAIFTDTQNDFGMPGFATLASSTYMDFQTLGITDPDYCMRDSK